MMKDQFVIVCARIRTKLGHAVHIEATDRINLTDSHDAFRLFTSVMSSVALDFREYVREVHRTADMADDEKRIVTQFGLAIEYLALEMQHTASRVAVINQVKP